MLEWPKRERRRSVINKNAIYARHWVLRAKMVFGHKMSHKFLRLQKGTFFWRVVDRFRRGYKFIHGVLKNNVLDLFKEIPSFHAKIP